MVDFLDPLALSLSLTGRAKAASKKKTACGTPQAVGNDSEVSLEIYFQSNLKLPG
jgi:hypothetical protein